MCSACSASYLFLPVALLCSLPPCVVVVAASSLALPSRLSAALFAPMSSALKEESRSRSLPFTPRLCELTLLPLLSPRSVCCAQTPAGGVHPSVSDTGVLGGGRVIGDGVPDRGPELLRAGRV